jgi:hypothetical protein
MSCFLTLITRCLHMRSWFFSLVFMEDGSSAPFQYGILIVVWAVSHRNAHAISIKPQYICILQGNLKGSVNLPESSLPMARSLKPSRYSLLHTKLTASNLFWRDFPLLPEQFRRVFIYQTWYASSFASLHQCTDTKLTLFACMFYLRISSTNFN